MSETLLKDMHKEMIEIRKRLESLEEAIIPSEEISEKELKEITQLKKESLGGKTVRWKGLKKELDL
ncbi:MAG: hypothetical protein U9N35_03775 [Euryarchaeota archaeon]|nr:hypothetical protein [Euryarchaeota archaeon]